MLSHNRLLLAVSALGLTMTFVNAEALVGKAEDAKKIIETQCAACHGVYGEGVAATPVQAKLGGQHENYLRIQLQALKASKDATGARFEITMAPQAGLLSDQDIANVAAYYSQQPISYFKFEDDFKIKREAAAVEVEKANAALAEIEAKEKALKEQLASDPDNVELQKEVKALPRALRSAKSGARRAEGAIDQLNKDQAQGEALMARGKQLYFGGDIAKRIPACVACHSPSGAGNGPAAYPVIAGQNYEYLVNQLENFRGSKRLNDPARMMRDIAERMSDAEIEAVSTYIKYMPSK